MAEILKKAPIGEPKIFDSKSIKMVWVKWFDRLRKLIDLNSAYRNRTTIIISNTDSPYTMVATEKNLKCDTDSGSITVLLEAGINGTKHKINNTGTSGNNVTVTPNGTDLLYQVNGSELIYDSENLDLDFASIEGWS